MTYMCVLSYTTATWTELVRIVRTFFFPLSFSLSQIVASAKDVVTSAKDAVSVTVTGAKDTVSDTLTSVVEKTRGAVQDGVEMTRAVVNGSVSTVLESRVVQLVSTGVDTALSTSENLVEQYLPLTEDELRELGQCQSQDTSTSYKISLNLGISYLRIIVSC